MSPDTNVDDLAFRFHLRFLEMEIASLSRGRKPHAKALLASACRMEVHLTDLGRLMGGRVDVAESVRQSMADTGAQ